jgi:hypothetical protein
MGAVVWRDPWLETVGTTPLFLGSPQPVPACRGPIPNGTHSPLCHPACPGVPWDRSAAEWRDLQFHSTRNQGNGLPHFPEP